jgi:peptidyl-prolyl cis-trans isomerase B (cyclophilin B)
MDEARRMPGVLLVGLWLLSAAVMGQPSRPHGGDVGPAHKPTPHTPAYTPGARTTAGPPRVVLEIGQGEEYWGRVVLELDPEAAPVTVRNFLLYVDSRFYEGTIFHRIAPNFIVQGGGYTTDGEPKTAGLRRPIKNEARTAGLRNLRGTVAMARAKKADSATSQFFINLTDNPGLDPNYAGGDGWGYCVFGKVVEGMEILDRMKGLATRENPRLPTEKTWPLNPPVIRKAYRVLREGTTMPADPGTLKMPEPPEVPSPPPDVEEPPPPPPELPPDVEPVPEPLPAPPGAEVAE